MNGTEAAYSRHLDLRKTAGEVLAYWFEEIKFRLADSTFYTPDFLVQLRDGYLECHEVKGSARNKVTGARKPFYEDDARVKIAVAAEHFPFRFCMVYLDENKNWAEREF